MARGRLEAVAVAAGDTYGVTAQLVADDPHLAADDDGIEGLTGGGARGGEAGVIGNTEGTHDGVFSSHFTVRTVP